MTDLIIFDCDGVLVDSEVIYLEVEREWVARAGLVSDRAEYIGAFSGLPVPDWDAQVTAALVAQTGRAPAPDYFDRMRAQLKTEFAERLQPVKGARAALEGLGRRACVASSSRTKALHWKLRHTGLHDLFDPHIFSTDLVSRGKPSPDLFLHAAEAMGAAPDDAIVVEDSANGVRAGKAAGMAVIGFTGGRHCEAGHDRMLRDAGADLVVSGYHALAEGLAEISVTGSGAPRH